MNEYEHEDAIRDANLCAGRRTKLADALKSVTDKQQGLRIISEAQDRYLDIFEAFIEGVAWARDKDGMDKGKP